MSCRDISSLITAFLDGELNDEEQFLVKAHLADCRHCRQETEAIASMQGSLRNAFRLETEEHSPPPRVWQRIRQYITAGQEPAPTATKKRGFSFFPIRISWKTGLVGMLVIALVAVLATTIPPLLKQDGSVLAEDIALNSTQLQAAFGSDETLEVTVLDTIDEGEYIRVLIAVGSDITVYTDVDMDTHEIVSLGVYEISDAKRQEIIDIARSYSIVQELFDKGAWVNNIEMGLDYTTLAEALADIDPQLVNVEYNGPTGLFGVLFLRLGDPDSPERYSVAINVTTGELLALFGPEGLIFPEGTIITIISSPDGTTTIIN